MRSDLDDSPRLGLGIDTGGTYTDAAIVDLRTKKVMAKAKSPTTYHDLAVGLGGAVKTILDDGLDTESIRLVGVSTTLATNSILEGKGGRVGLIGIGWEPKEGWHLGDQRSVFIKGGHEVTGMEKEPLDAAGAEAALDEIIDHVDAVAISGLFSVYNHNHERRLRRMLRERSGLPVVCGHELTGELGIQERTVTAVLNARLIPILDTFLDDVQRTMSGNGIQAPIMVFKGDGSLMNIETAKERPVETIMSGPAASSMGGRMLTGLQDCIVVDVGGTSTDIAFLDGGFPRIVPEGAHIGQWRTRVRAVDMWTSALGGDSEIVVDRWGNLEFRADRVVPLSTAAKLHPELLEKMKETGEIRFLMAYDRDPSSLDRKERLLFDYLVENGPSTYTDLKANLDIVLLDRFVKRMRDRNMVVGIGLTPTDVMHLNGNTSSGDIVAAEMGVDASRVSMKRSRDEFVDHVLNLMVSRLSQEVLKKIMIDDGGVMPDDGPCNFLLENVSGGKMSDLLDMKAIVKRSIVGIGAPAHVYVPYLESRLGTEVIVPENHEVGNAVGAVCSPIVETASAVIFPEDGKFHMFSSFYIPVTYAHIDQATGAARNMVEKHAREKAEKAGARDVEVKVETDVRKSIGGELVEGEIISRIDIRARAVGHPPM